MSNTQVMYLKNQHVIWREKIGMRIRSASCNSTAVFVRCFNCWLYHTCWQKDFMNVIIHTLMVSYHKVKYRDNFLSSEFLPQSGLHSCCIACNETTCSAVITPVIKNTLCIWADETQLWNSVVVNLHIE